MLVEDGLDFNALHPGLGCPVVRPAGGWPTLNDTDGRHGYADIVVIRDAFGTCVDSVAYRKAWSVPGCSVERIETGARSAIASNWSRGLDYQVLDRGGDTRSVHSASFVAACGAQAATGGTWEQGEGPALQASSFSRRRGVFVSLVGAKAILIAVAEALR